MYESANIISQNFLFWVDIANEHMDTCDSEPWLSDVNSIPIHQLGSFNVRNMKGTS